MIIYHNSRCKKSREAIAIIEAEGQKFEIREYLKNPLTKAEIVALRDKLGISAENMIRKNESIFKENFKGKILDEEAYLDMMVSYPILIERPIVENGKMAIIGRPPDIISTMFT